MCDSILHQDQFKNNITNYEFAWYFFWKMDKKLPAAVNLKLVDRSGLLTGILIVIYTLTQKKPSPKKG